MNTSKNISGPNIRKARLEKGLTQEELAKLMRGQGVAMSRKSISNIECGRRCVWDNELTAIIKCLNVSANMLLGWEEETSCSL